MNVTNTTKKRFQFFRESLSILKNTLPYTYTEHTYFHICRTDFLCTVDHFIWLLQSSRGIADIVLVLGMDPRISYMLDKLLAYASLGFGEISSSCDPPASTSYNAAFHPGITRPGLKHIFH